MKKLKIKNGGKSLGTETVFQSGGNEKELDFRFGAYEIKYSPSQECHGDFVTHINSI